MIIFDIDGILADCRHRLHFIEGKKKNYKSFYNTVGDDKPISSGIKLLNLLATSNEEIVLLTGRNEICGVETVSWLDVNDVKYNGIIMREVNDHRPDYEFKKKNVKNLMKSYDILCAFDNSPKVVEMYREIGITCYTNTDFRQPEEPEDRSELAQILDKLKTLADTSVKWSSDGEVQEWLEESRDRLANYLSTPEKGQNE